MLPQLMETPSTSKYLWRQPRFQHSFMAASLRCLDAVPPPHPLNLSAVALLVDEVVAFFTTR